MKTTKGELLHLLEATGVVKRPEIGRIELRGIQAVVEIPGGNENRLVKALDGVALGERRLRAWIASDAPQLSDPDHFIRMQRLLEMESKAQAQRVRATVARMSPAQAEQRGYSLVGMVVDDLDAGLGGRQLLRLVKRTRVPLPRTRLRVGTPVVLSPEGVNKNIAHRGVVCERTEQSIQIALSEVPEDLDDYEIWRLDDSDDETSVQRQRAALERVRMAEGDRLAALRRVLMGEKSPRSGADKPFTWLNRNLNAPQQEAVTLALRSEDVALIHGPPGTGKTTTVIEVIRQAVRRGQKVLACAPSNMGVDNLFERLLYAGEKAVRLGHPARVLPELREHTLDLLVEVHPDVRLARKLARDAMVLFRKADTRRRGKPMPGQRYETRQQAKSLLADAKRLEARAVEHILDTADILCATTTSLDSELLGMRRFDLAVIDEACQSTEPGCWIPLLRSERVLLAGDHCQLPPTVLSHEADEAGFSVSLFERVRALVGPDWSRQLTVQYRMHQQIMEFPSQEFYADTLVAHPAVAEHRLCDLPEIVPTPLTELPMEFIDTAGAGYDEESEPDGESRLNPQEAALVTQLVNELLEAGIAAEMIGVIAPYAGQVRLLENLLPIDGLEIDTVDGFQGREKEVILISLVRSNVEGEIGFLKETRRTNVALTRARRKLIVIGDSATLASDPFYARMIDNFQAAGGYRTVWEL